MYNSEKWDLVVLLHTITILLAFFISFFIFYNKKGTFLHQILGRIFVISMLISMVSSFWIRTSGHYSFIHLLSVATVFWLIRAIYAVRVKMENWLYIHVSNMYNAFIGIVIAGTGVIVRHFIFPGDKIYWPIISTLVAFIIIPFMIKNTLKYKKKIEVN